MADIEVVINIPEKMYNMIKNKLYCGIHDVEVYEAIIRKGIPLPKGHGDLIDRKLVLSDDGLCEFHRYDDYVKMRNYLKSIPIIIEAYNESEDKE